MCTSIAHLELPHSLHDCDLEKDRPCETFSYVQLLKKVCNIYFHKLNTCARERIHVHSLLSPSPNLSAVYAQMHFTYRECFVVLNIDFVVLPGQYQIHYIKKKKKKKKQ